jgi:hypothetical protein
MAAKLTTLTHKKNDTTAPSDRELHHLEFSLQAAGPDTFGYTLVGYRFSGNSVFFNLKLNTWKDVCLSVTLHYFA